MSLEQEIQVANIRVFLIKQDVYKWTKRPNITLQF